MITFLAAPIFYLAPTSIGVLALWRFREKGLSAWLPIAFLFGTVLTTRAFEAAEWAEVVDSYYYAMVTTTAAVSLIGFVVLVIAVKEVSFRWDAIILGALVAVPSYAYWSLWVSRYPFTDLFQDIHPMKMAEEFARTHVLNGLDSNSYIPVKPVLNALLISLFDYSQLLGVWALAPWTAIFRLLVAWQASRLAMAGSNRMLMFVLLSVWLFGFELTNGMLCAFGSILLLVLLIDMGEMFERPSTGAAIALIVPILGYFAWRLLSPYPLWNAIMLVVVAIGTALLPRNHARKCSTILLALILIGCLVPLHRGTLLFMPIVAFSSAAWILRNQRWVLIAATLSGGLALPVALGCAALVLGAAVFHITIPSLLEDKLFAIASKLTSLGGAEALLGSGVKNAAIEWGQAIGALPAVLLGMVFAWSIASSTGRSIWRDPLFVVPWGLAAALTVVVLTGFPYAARGMPFVCVFFALALSNALPPLWAHLRESRGIFLAIPLALCFVYALVMRIAPLSAYSEFFFPLLIYWVVIGVIACFLLYWSAFPRSASLLVVLGLLLSVDRQSGRVALFPHAYGNPSQNGSKALSHYDSAELKIAVKLKEMPPTTLVISDPLTLSIMRAISGLNGAVAYSNLDTLSEEPDRYLRSILDAFSEGDPQKSCDALLSGRATAREYRHLVRRLLIPSEGLDAVIVYSARTQAWLLATGTRVSYFPSAGILDETSVRAIKRIDPNASFEENKIALARLRCRMTE